MYSEKLALIEKDILEVNKSIKRNKYLQLKYPDKDGVKVNYNTLIYVHDQLMEKRENLLHKLEIESIEVVFESDSIKYNLIPVALIGPFLDRFQKLINYVVRSIMEGRDATGRVSMDVINASTYKVSSFDPGSFKITLISDPSLSEQTTFSNTTAKRALDKVTDLMKCEDDLKLIREQQEVLGLAPILKYKDFLQTIYLNKADVTFNDFTSREVQSEKISSEMAKRIYDVLNNSEDEEPDKKTYEGTLVAVDVDKYEFGFVIAGDPEERIDGKFNSNIKSTVKSHLDQFSEAKFERSKKYDELKDEYRYSWELLCFN